MYLLNRYALLSLLALKSSVGHLDQKNLSLGQVPWSRWVHTSFWVADVWLCLIRLVFKCVND